MPKSDTSSAVCNASQLPIVSRHNLSRASQLAIVSRHNVSYPLQLEMFPALTVPLPSYFPVVSRHNHYGCDARVTAFSCFADCAVFVTPSSYFPPWRSVCVIVFGCSRHNVSRSSQLPFVPAIIINKPRASQCSVVSRQKLVCRLKTIKIHSRQSS